MQQTGLPRSNTARRTGHREPLFFRQVALPHFDTVRQKPAVKLSQSERYAHNRNPASLPDTCWQRAGGGPSIPKDTSEWPILSAVSAESLNFPLPRNSIRRVRSSRGRGLDEAESEFGGSGLEV